MFKVFDNNYEDVVLGNFIAYMNKSLLHKRINYLKHQQFLQQKESNLNQEEWEMLSVKDNKLHSSFSFEMDKLYGFFENEKVAKAFSKLTLLQQKVLYWNIAENIPMTEIGKILKITDSSVQKIKLRAMKSLKKYLEEKDDRKN